MDVDQESHVLWDFSNCKLNLSFPSTCESLESPFDMEIMTAGN